MFGIQISVLIVAVFTAFVGYQFRIREKKRDTSYSELVKSFNEIYSPLSFRLREINQLPNGEKKNELLNKFFEDFGLGSSKAHLIGSSELLDSFFELNTLYRAQCSEPEIYKEKFESVLKIFESQITDEFWDAHNIIYKEHQRFKNYHFKPIRALFIDLIGTIKYVTELAACFAVFAWLYILSDSFAKEPTLAPEIKTYIQVVSIAIFIFYALIYGYYFIFYKDSSNFHKKRKKRRKKEKRFKKD